MPALSGRILANRSSVRLSARWSLRLSVTVMALSITSRCRPRFAY
jgi:hypothetical protein